MKKLLLIICMLMYVPAFALCPIENGEAVCSLPEYREQISPVFQDNNNINTASPNVKLQPLGRADPINQMREPNNSLNYNSGCQFGVCLQNPKESRLPNDIK